MTDDRTQNQGQVRESSPRMTIFTVEEANKILPLVKSIAKTLVDEFQTLRTAGRERRALEVEAGGIAGSETQIEELKDKVKKSSGKIERYLKEFSDLGLEVRDLELGLIDFPALVDGKPAYLSWRLGEDRVEWWHPADKRFSDRVLVKTPRLDGTI